MHDIKPASSYPTIPKSFVMADGTPDYLRLILTSRVYDVCKETEMSDAHNLSAKLGVNVLLKREDLQPVFSFKLRGAYNMIAHIPKEERWKGVVACSAGNHAQGVAYSAKHLDIPATIVMPVATPAIKYSNVGRLGAKVVLHGDDFDAAKEECNRLAEAHGLKNIPPFDDPYVIAGQGTIGMEILRQVDLSQLTAVVACIGGGGLLAGIATYIKRIAPHVKIIGVETYDADAMYQSLNAGEKVKLKEVGLFADGTAVKVVGTETMRLCSKYVDEIVRVNTDEICAAIKAIFMETRAVSEPSGALAVAGLTKYIESKGDQLSEAEKGSYVAIVSGANMDFDRLRFVSERSRLGSGSEAFLIATIPEKPGSFESLIDHVNPRATTEFSYRYNDYQADTNGSANVYLSFTTKERGEVPVIRKQMEETGIKTVDISDNEFAKSHARYLVGGHANVPNERIISFEFPERPGALYRFLKANQSKWNITLFHYRNYGSDVANVLAGMDVPPSDDEEFKQFLKTLGYPYREETDNEVYKIFLRGK